VKFTRFVVTSIMILSAASLTSAFQATKSAAKPAPKTALPAPIEAAFKAAYPTATIKNVMKEKENGKDVYEVESIDQGLTRDLIYRPDGTVVLVEEQVSEADVPAPVVAALKAQFPKATITRREKVTENGAIRYEFQLKGAKVTSAEFTPDGKPVKK